MKSQAQPPVGSDRRTEGTPSPRQRGLLALQRAAGNAAVTALLSDDGRPALQRAGLSDTLQEVLSTGSRTGRTTGAGPRGEGTLAAVQRDLAVSLRTMVDGAAPPTAAALITAIRAAPAVERRAVLGDTDLMRLIGSKLGSRQATPVASALLEGTRKWKNPTDNDFFEYFYLNTGPGPRSTASTMNCWESIIYAAFLVNAVSADWVKKFYTDAFAAPDVNAAIWTLLGWTPALPVYKAAGPAQPRTGQLVFYYTPGSPYPGHVAIYMGNGQVMSLWHSPNNIDKIQLINITDLAGRIQYGNAPW